MPRDIVKDPQERKDFVHKCKVNNLVSTGCQNISKMDISRPHLSMSWVYRSNSYFKYILSGESRMWLDLFDASMYLGESGIRLK